MKAVRIEELARPPRGPQEPSAAAGSITGHTLAVDGDDPVR